MHFIFKKRYYERIFSTLREEVCKMLVKEVEGHKKPKDIRGKVIERIAAYKADFKEMAEIMMPERLKIEKELNEVTMLLTTQKREDIAYMMTSANDFYRRCFKK